MAHFRKLPHICKKSLRYLLHKPNYSQFCPKLRCHGNGSRSKKNAIGSIRWPIRENPPIGAKISQKFLYKPSYGQFCPKFRCRGNGGRSGKNAIGSVRWPIHENPRVGAKIFYVSRVIANFVSHFVAIATGVNRG